MSKRPSSEPSNAGTKAREGRARRPASWTPTKPDARGAPPALVSQLLFGLQAYVADRTGAFLTHDQWRTIVGERIAAHCRVGKNYQGTLTVQVASSAWCSELSFLSEDILEKLFRAGYEVKKLRFVVDPEARDKKAVKRRPVPAAYAPVPPLQLPPELEARLAKIEDANLRATIAAAARASLARPPELPAEPANQPIKSGAPAARHTKSRSSSS